MNHVVKELGHWLSNRGRMQRVPALGERELEVLKILWRSEQLSAQQVLGEIADTDITLSTLQSTLERLYRKKLASREKVGRSYFYRASVSQSAIISNLLEDIAEQFSDGNMAPMISGFMAFVGRESADTLAPELQQLMQESADDEHE